MNEIKKRLLDYKVAIYDVETNEEINVTTVQDIVEGFDFYIEWSRDRNQFVLIDYQDTETVRPLGETIYETLHELNQYTEYFNDLDEWESQFLDYFDAADLTDKDRKNLSIG